MLLLCLGTAESEAGLPPSGWAPGGGPCPPAPGAPALSSPAQEQRLLLVRSRSRCPLPGEAMAGGWGIPLALLAVLTLQGAGAVKGG